MSHPFPIRRPSARAAIPLFTLVVLVLFLLRQAVFEGRVFYERDLHLQWYGQVETFVRCVFQGSWPLWDPYVSFGQPLLANANNQIFYPPTWLHLVMRPWTYYTLFFGAHLVFTGLGVVRLGERFGLSRYAALFAAMLWVASGPLLSLGNAWNHLAASAWIPWLLLATDTALTSRRAGPILAAAAAWALQIFTGSPDVVVMTAAITAACTARRWNWRSWADRANLRIALAGSCVGVVALGLSAAQWIPSLELASRSDRWNLGELQRTYWSIHPVGLLQTIVPVWWYEIPFNGQWRDALFEGREPFLFSVYIGIPMLALALLAVGRSRDGLRLSLFATGIIAALLALGRHAPFYPLAVHVLPPLRVLRFPAKALIPAAFCFSMLAGMGFDAWRVRGPRPGALLAGALLASFGSAAALLAVLARVDAGTWGPLFLVTPGAGASYGELLATLAWKLAWVAGLAFSILGLLVLRCVRGGALAGLSAAMLATLAVSDLAWNARQINHTAPKTLYTMKPEAAAAVEQKDLGRLYVFDYSMTEGRSRRYLGRETPYLVPGFRRDTPFQWAEAFGLRMYLVPPIGAAWRLFGSYERDNLGIQPTALVQLNAAVVSADGSPLQERLLRLGAVTQVLSLHSEGLEGLEPVRSLPGPFLEPIHLFRVRGALPRTYMVGNSRVADGSAALDALGEPGFDIHREIVLSSGTPHQAGPDFRGASRVVEMKPDRVRIESNSNQAGYVVLVDAYDPGWEARVDGREAPVVRANVAFRAVAVSEGAHVVDLAYRPRSVLLGVGLSTLSLMACLTTSLVSRGQRVRPEPGDLT